MFTPALTIRAFPNTVACSRAAICILLQSIYACLLPNSGRMPRWALTALRTAKAAYSAATSRAWGKTPRAGGVEPS